MQQELTEAPPPCSVIKSKIVPSTTFEPRYGASNHEFNHELLLVRWGTLPYEGDACCSVLADRSGS